MKSEVKENSLPTYRHPHQRQHARPSKHLPTLAAIAESRPLRCRSFREASLGMEVIVPTCRQQAAGVGVYRLCRGSTIVLLEMSFVRKISLRGVKSGDAGCETRAGRPIREGRYFYCKGTTFRHGLILSFHSQS